MYLGYIKTVASLGKGLTVVARGQPARIIAVVAATGIVTISVMIAIGAYVVLRASRLTKNSSLKNTPSSHLIYS